MEKVQDTFKKVMEDAAAAETKNAAFMKELAPQWSDRLVAHAQEAARKAKRVYLYRTGSFKKEQWAESPPVVAVEVRSPGDTSRMILKKIDEYLAFGVNVVWLVDFEEEFVTMYRDNRKPQTFDLDDTLECPELPGFSYPVSHFFMVASPNPRFARLSGARITPKIPKMPKCARPIRLITNGKTTRPSTNDHAKGTMFHNALPTVRSASPFSTLSDFTDTRCGRVEPILPG